MQSYRNLRIVQSMNNSCKTFYVKSAQIFVLAFLIGACSDKGSYNYDKNPYDRFDITVNTVPVPDSDFNLDTLNKIKIKGPPIRYRDLDILEYKAGKFLILDRNKLYRIVDDGHLKIIAEEGKGPGEIFDGRGLIKHSEDIYLLQGNRISRYDSDHNHLEVVRNTNELLFYYEKIDSTNNLIINKYNPGGPGFIIASPELTAIDTLGGYVENDDLRIDQMFYSYVEFNWPEELYLETFSGLPYMAFFDSDLKMQKLFKLEDFHFKKIVEDKFEKNKLTYKTTKLKSSIANVHVTASGTFFIAVAYYRSMREASYQFESVEQKIHFNYYLIDSDLNVKPLGKSDYVVAPYGDRYIYLNDGDLFITDKL